MFGVINLTMFELMLALALICNQVADSESYAETIIAVTERRVIPEEVGDAGFALSALTRRIQPLAPGGAFVEKGMR